MISLDVARRLAQALKPSSPDVAEASGGVVTRLDNDGTVWVQLHGADDDTPCTSQTAAVRVGDAVTVTIDGGSARVDGNVTRPATDDERAEEAHELAAQATEEVSEVREQTRANIMATAIAQSIAEQAQAVADAINQHFWADGSGVHVTEAEGDPTTEHNILINSLGILLRKATYPLVSITQSAIAFYDGLGSAAGNIVASFGSSGFQVGMEDESHLVGDYHSLQLVDKEGRTYFHVSDLRDATGEATLTETFTGDGSTTTFEVYLFPSGSPSEVDDCSVTVDGDSVSFTRSYKVFTLGQAPADGATVVITYPCSDNMLRVFTFGKRGVGGVGPNSFASGVNIVASGYSSHAEGYASKASGSDAHAEGSDTLASGQDSHAEGEETKATARGSHAEGWRSEVTGFAAHAEGMSTEASGEASHAEGWATDATGHASHAEGYHTAASGTYSHAEGNGTVASGDYSHAEGNNTKALSPSQSVVGRYNVTDSSNTYALIVGNGTADHLRSNAFAVKWDGTTSIFSSNLDGSTTPSSQLTGYGVELRDSASSLIGRFAPRQQTSGANGILLESRATYNGNSVWNTLGLWVNRETGERTVGVSEAAPWLKALGLNVVEQTTGFSRNTSNVTEVVNQRWVKQGSVVYFYLTVKLTNALTGGDSTGVQLGTAPSGFRPVGANAVLSSTYPWWGGYMGTGGGITFRSDHNVGAGSNVNIAGCFVIGLS